MGGWPRECCTNNMLVYTPWMQMIDWGHKLGEFTRQKASCTRPCFVDEIGGFALRFNITPRRGAFDLSPRRLGLMCAALLWLHLLCFVSLQILILKVQTRSPRGGRQSRECEHPTDASPVGRLLFEKPRKMEKADRLLNICAAGRARDEKLRVLNTWRIWERRIQTANTSKNLKANFCGCFFGHKQRSTHMNKLGTPIESMEEETKER